MKVFVYSAHGYEIPFLERSAEGKHTLIFNERKLDQDTAKLAIGCEAVALFTADDASAPVLQKLHSYGVRYVALRSAGYDHVDLSRATKLGMQVANVPAYSPYSIAEHAVAMLLALNRKIAEAQSLIRLQDFRLDTLVGFDIHGKTVGIIGTGTIGKVFATIMKGFGARVIGFDPAPNEEAVRIGVEYVTFEEVLRQSDIVSLHCPLNDQTRYMISRPQIARMKKGAILINTARGGVVNTLDLLEALDNEHLAGACLDVYEKEKAIFFEDHRRHPLRDSLFARLVAHNRVLITGHQAFLTIEALQGIASTTVQNLDYWEDGMASPNNINQVINQDVVSD